MLGSGDPALDGGGDGWWTGSVIRYNNISDTVGSSSSDGKSVCVHGVLKWLSRFGWGIYLCRPKWCDGIAEHHPGRPTGAIFDNAGGNNTPRTTSCSGRVEHRPHGLWRAWGLENSTQSESQPGWLARVAHVLSCTNPATRSLQRRCSLSSRSSSPTVRTTISSGAPRSTPPARLPFHRSKTSRNGRAALTTPRCQSHAETRLAARVL